MVKKRPSTDPSPSYSYHAAGEDARARMRQQTLLQDYQDLIKETDAKKKRILKAKQKKLKLSAEVKYLRRKLKSLGDHSLEIPIKLKKDTGLLSEAHLDDRSHKIRGAPTRGTSTSSELNQVPNRPASLAVRYAQLHNSGLPSNTFSVDRSCKVTKAAARETKALLDLSQSSNRLVPPAMSYAHMHNSGLPPKAPPVDWNQKLTLAATLKTTTLSDSNQVSYRQAPPSSGYSHMHNSGLPLKAPWKRIVTEAATRENTGLFDLNQISYRAAPPSAGNYEVTEAATRGTSALLDLNQDIEGFEEQETPKIDCLKRFSVGRSTPLNDHKLLLCRDGGTEGNKLPLRV